MPESIVNIAQMSDALRNTGYKNLESAVAEIVDNSIEAGATEVLILLTESSNLGPKKQIKDIAVLDNGSGMNSEILNKSLGLGSTTRAARKGMGRFGVGLPQASLYATPHVEVYSWQNGIDNSEMVYLDIKEVKSGSQKEIADPQKVEIPNIYSLAKKAGYDAGDKKFDFTKTGTLVIWKDCDRLNPKTATAITRRFKKELGKKFRHYIHDGKVDIRIVTLAEDSGSIERWDKVYPNDPLMLMEDNYLLGRADHPGKAYDSKDSQAEPIFEIYNPNPDEFPDGRIVKTIEYKDSAGNFKKGEVTVTFSLVKKKFYDRQHITTTDPGNTDIGKMIKDKVGISIIRHGREIDFGEFDYFSSVNEPTHRWWGCEISFEPDLDEVFGVSNNKQQVELITTDDSYGTFEEEGVEPLWNQLHFIKDTIKTMYNINKERRSRTRGVVTPPGDKPGTPEKPEPTQTQDIVNSVEEGQDDNPTDTPVIPREEVVELIKGDDMEPTEELIEFWQKQRIKFSYVRRGELNPPFDFEQKQNLSIVYINIESPFYRDFVAPIQDLTEETSITMFELLLASYAKALEKLSSYQNEQDMILTRKWRRNLDEYIEKMNE